MKYPSTVSLTEDTYRRLLVDVCSCYRTHGFKHVVLIGDSGGNQDGMKAVAAELNAKWKDGKTKFHFISEYYNYGDLKGWLEERGIKQTDEGLHDDFAMEAMMLSIDPASVRMKQRVKAGKFKINGVDLAGREDRRDRQEADRLSCGTHREDDSKGDRRDEMSQSLDTADTSDIPAMAAAS